MFANYFNILGQAPPVTITGVAPWATTLPQSSNVTTTLNRFREVIPPRPAMSTTSTDGRVQSNREILEEFMLKCMPPSDEDKLRGTDADWRVQQAALTPTLLPSLKFHDIVFGKLVNNLNLLHYQPDLISIFSENLDEGRLA